MKKKKFTKSNDGEYRTTVRVEARLTPSQIYEIKKAMKKYDGSKSEKDFRKFLRDALRQGISDFISNENE